MTFGCFLCSQVSKMYGLMFVVTKYGQLYVCDLESATCLCSVAISSDVVFLATLNSLTQGLIGLNTAGQVSLTHIFLWND